MSDWNESRDAFGRKEYITEYPTDEKKFGKLPLEECQVACVACHELIPVRIMVTTLRYPKGIEGVVNFLNNNGVGHVCESCYKKSGLVAGPLDKVKDR